VTADQPDQALEQAVDVLLQGGLVAFPTETVYGLGADASNPEAVRAIYAAKGRPSNHPVIVHLARAADLWSWVSVDEQTKAVAQRLIDAFWPGPLTLILKRNEAVPGAVSGGQDTIGVRCPAHPVAQALLTAFAQARGSELAGVAAPSANRFGHVSPTRAQHVRDEFADLVRAGLPVIEGGDSDVGIESTIIDLSRFSLGHGVALLRPGGVSAAALAQVLGEPLRGVDAQAPRVSGSLKAHYSPHTPIRLYSLKKMVQEVPAWLAHNAGNLALGLRQCEVVALESVATNQRISISVLPDDAAGYARELYARLRDLDQGGFAELRWVDVPTEPEWAGVADRLSRAAAAFADDHPAH
jgi:L-threonylcarbamoyladenylate synthase